MVNDVHKTTKLGRGQHPAGSTIPGTPFSIVLLHSQGKALIQPRDVGREPLFIPIFTSGFMVIMIDI